MTYILTHKKIPVMEVEIDEATAVISKIRTVFAPERIPIGITVKGNQPDRGDMNDWWHGRSIPASRQNIQEALQRLGVATADKLTIKSYGLSLSDQYWINPVSNTLDWESINFFDNRFSNDVGDILFGIAPNGAAISLLSPDNTSDGWLKKKWKIINGKRSLIKGGSDPFQQQPINEEVACAVMERLGIAHVTYSVIWDAGFPYSVCENFITADTELVSAYYIHNTKRITDIHNTYEHYIDCCADLGIPDARLAVDKMLTVDYIIANYDRHYANFGAVRNAETLDWLMPAPLYDNGSSLWCNYDASAIRASETARSQPFCDFHEEQIKFVSDFSWLDVRCLKNIDEEIYEILLKARHINADRRDAICFAFRKRVNNLVKLVEK